MFGFLRGWQLGSKAEHPRGSRWTQHHLSRLSLSCHASWLALQSPAWADARVGDGQRLSVGRAGGCGRWVQPSWAVQPDTTIML